jgi:hypothetical protein
MRVRSNAVTNCPAPSRIRNRIVRWRCSPRYPYPMVEPVDPVGVSVVISTCRP